MRMFTGSFFIVAAICAFSFAASAQNLPCKVMSTGVEASLNGYVMFPSDNLWNQNISSAEVDPNSDAIINFIGGSVPLHPDFGSGLYGGQSMGIPYNIVPDSTNRVTIHFTAYGDESDPGPMPVAPGTPVKLSWTVSNALYDIVSPQVGAIRGTSVVVKPEKTTTYTLYATNQYGRSTAKVTVQVQ
jgi:hypothetical protein